jgi:putative oxidoreductase
MDIGLLVLRAVVGLLLAGHGAQKLFGWFGGHGLRGTTGFLESLGWRPGRTFALLLGAGELAGGLALALGFVTPLAAAALMAVLANAALVVHGRNGLWNTEGGFEYPLVLACVALALAFTGPGRFSLDQLIGWHTGGVVWGFAAVLLGVLGLVVGLAAQSHGHGERAGRDGAVGHAV